MSEEVIKIVSFLESIGVEVRVAELTGPTFLPGVTLSEGGVVYDPSRLEFPGDLVHEAGHLAFAPPSVRGALSSKSTFDAGEEMAAIAWSWAAVVAMELAPEIVFHDKGYFGGAKAIVENFAAGRYVGVSMLEWAGMAVERKRREDPAGKFPAMIHWLRPE